MAGGMYSFPIKTRSSEGKLPKLGIAYQRRPKPLGRRRYEKSPDPQALLFHHSLLLLALPLLPWVRLSQLLSAMHLDGQVHTQ